MAPEKGKKMSHSEMTLSVYNRPISLARSKTPRVNLMEGLPTNIVDKLDPPKLDLDENGDLIEKPQPETDKRIPDTFNIPKNFLKKNLPSKFLYEKNP